MRTLRFGTAEGFFLLSVEDTGKRDEHGKHVVSYRFWKDVQVEPIFAGADYCTHSDAESDESVRGLLGFLTLKPGDTDSEYFEKYTPRQVEFTESGAIEELAMWSVEDGEPWPLEDVR